MDYKKQLQELYDSYTGKSLEGVLGVSTRSIQNYLKKENPTIPGKEVVIKIREVFANHKEGRILDFKESVNEPAKSQQSIDELIRANNTLADANKRLADAHYIISETNKELMLMAKEVFNYRKQESSESLSGQKEGGTIAAEEALRQNGRIGPFSIPEASKPKDSLRKKGR